MTQLREHLTTIAAEEVGFEPETAWMLQRAIESCQACNINNTPLEDFQEQWLNPFQDYAELKADSEGEDVTRQQADLLIYRGTLAKAISQMEQKSRLIDLCLNDRAKGKPCRLAAKGSYFDALLAEVTGLQEMKVNLELVIGNLEQEIANALVDIDFSGRDEALQGFVESMNRHIDRLLRSGYLE